MAPGSNNDDEPKVKELLAGAPLDSIVDAATQRELEKWFQLPSFEEVAERPLTQNERDIKAVQERRAKACEAVDPKFVDAIHMRREDSLDGLIKFEPNLEVHVDADLPMFDFGMADRVYTIAEPREVEISEEMRDDLKEVAPQALLRDLHRPETDFEMVFEVVDMSAEQKLDIVAEVAEAMRTKWTLQSLGLSPFEEERRGLERDREIRRQPWSQLPMPNRRVTD